MLIVIFSKKLHCQVFLFCHFFKIELVSYTRYVLYIVWVSSNHNAIFVFNDIVNSIFGLTYVQQISLLKN